MYETLKHKINKLECELKLKENLLEEERSKNKKLIKMFDEIKKKSDFEKKNLENIIKFKDDKLEKNKIFFYKNIIFLVLKLNLLKKKKTSLEFRLDFLKDVSLAPLKEIDIDNENIGFFDVNNDFYLITNNDINE